MKRLSSFTLLMLLLMLSTNAYAHDFQQKNGSQTIYYIWINNNTELAVSYRGSSLSQYSNHYVGKIVIPESVTHNGKTYSVTSIGNNAFNYCRNLTSVTIPNSVTSIGGSAFDYCTGLTSVTISNSVTSIGENAFSWCSSLTSVTIPNNVTSIGNSAFSDCSGLTSVTIGNSVTSIGNSAFQKCTGLTSVTIPNSVTSIGNSAFFGCTGLTTVTIPNSVTSIGYGAFSDCTGFTSIKVESENIRYDSRDNCNAIIETESNTLIAGCQNTIIPNNVTIIGNRAFSGCSGLTSITIPNSVTSIGNSAFWGCTGLTSVTIPNNVTSIGDNAFCVCTGLTSLTIGNSVTSIGRSAFEGCRNITTITSLNSIPPTIDWSTFFNMVGNYSATLKVPKGSKTAYQNADYWKNFKNIVEVDPSPEGDKILFTDASVKAICVANWDTNGDGELSKSEAAAVTDLGTVFQNRTDIKTFEELKYFTGLSSIGDNAFFNCKNLTSVTIPNSVTSIGKYSFMHCIGLTSITIPNNVTSIGDSAFSSSGLTSITIPNSVKSIGSEAFRNNSVLTSIVVEEGNTKFDSRNNCNAIIETTSSTLIFGCKNTIIPNNVESIGKAAFMNCSDLTTITIPNSVKSIGFCAFAYCSGLTSITIPKGVINIDYAAFQNCSGLTSIVVDSDNSKYDSRDNCNSIIETASNRLVLGCQNTVIPNNVTCIGNAAFSGCSGLTSITIPNSVTNIEESAFIGCSGLTSFTVPNSVTTIKSGTFSGCTSLTSILINNNVTSIGFQAFFICKNLTSITIPNNVKSIGDYAFWGCSGLTFVTTLNSTPPTINPNTFNDYSATLQVPTGSKTAYQNAEYWKNFTNIVEIDPTGVQIITLDKDTNAPIYDLNGRKLKEPNKGINIIGGKKVVVK